MSELKTNSVGQTRLRRIFGVDFSGAKLAGRNIWVAEIDVASKTVVRLNCLAALAGTEARAPALAHLVAMIAASDECIWGIDFPFALPIEIAAPAQTFADQLRWLTDSVDDAYGFGRGCVARAKSIGREMHVRRDTDRETKTPFDCYHYRIICQTFYGMRNVLAPLLNMKGTVIPPFTFANDFQRAVVEACPGSTLKRWKAPHNNYKQPAGGPLERKRLVNRKIILDRVREYVTLDDRFVRIIQRNPGGDALDAVLAAVGVWQSWEATDFDAMNAHPRYRFEGRIFA